MKTIRSQAGLLLTNTPVGAGGALQSALQYTTVIPALLQYCDGKQSLVEGVQLSPNRRDQLMPFMCRRSELLDHRCDNVINKSIVSAEIGAGEPSFFTETNVPLHRGTVYSLSTICGPRRLCSKWDCHGTETTDVRQWHEAGFNSVQMRATLIADTVHGYILHTQDSRLVLLQTPEGHKKKKSWSGFCVPSLAEILQWFRWEQ